MSKRNILARNESMMRASTTERRLRTQTPHFEV